MAENGMPLLPEYIEYFDPFFQDAINPSGAYWLFAAFCLIMLIYTIVAVKETKGKNMLEIAAMFGDQSAIESLKKN